MESQVNCRYGFSFFFFLIIYCYFYVSEGGNHSLETPALQLTLEDEFIFQS